MGILRGLANGLKAMEACREGRRMDGEQGKGAANGKTEGKRAKRGREGGPGKGVSA